MSGIWSVCQHIFWGVLIPDGKERYQGSFEKGLEESSLVEEQGNEDEQKQEGLILKVIQIK